MGKKILIGCAVIIGLLFASAMVLVVLVGIGIESGHIPDIEIATGKTLTAKHREVAREAVPFAEDERLEWLYGAGLFKYEEDLQFMTTHRLVVVWTDATEGVQSFELDRDAIGRVDVKETATDFTDGTTWVYGLDDEEWIQLTLSAEKRLDEWVIEELRELAETNRAAQAEATPAGDGD